MNIRALGGGLMATALVAVLGVLALPAEAADYAFLVRGVVESVDTANNTLIVKGTWASTAAIADTQSKNITYTLRDTAPVYRWEDGVKVLRNLAHVGVGDEVVMKGNKSGGSFLVDNWLVINDRTFEVVGRVTDYDTSEDWIEILVGRSTHKHAGVQNTRIKFHYIGDTTCMRLGTEIGCSEIANQDQGIKVKGTRAGGSGQWDITHAWNNYPI